ncbi:MAG: quinoprotein relay system zinc metallohydrolase 2 [Gallionella sp.]|nr:quinoprotein relay system zinc metallohydrolase 2 [Gallionella sp.]
MLKTYLIFFALFLPAFAHAEALTVEQAAPGIYVHHGTHRDINIGYGGDICNIGFIVGKKGVAVVDSGGSPRVGAQLREAVRKVTKLPILYVINTHVHPDHVFGNAAFKDDHPVFVGHENLAAAMALRKEAYLRNQEGWVGADAAGSELIPPALAIKGTHTIDLGGRTLQLTAHPAAHTNNDLTVFDSATATLWTGDLLYVERTPAIDGDLKGWLQVIKQLRTIPAMRAIPGHGPVVADWQGAFDNESRYLSRLLEDVRAAIKQGRSMEQAINESVLSEQGKWVLFDIVNRRNVSLVFPVLEWE